MLSRALALTPALVIAGCFMEMHHDAGFEDIEEDIHTVVIEVETGAVLVVPVQTDGAVVD